MEDILRAMLEGAMQQQGQQRRQQQPQAPADPLAEILGGILGGSAAPQPRQQGGADPMADILGGILGGGGSAPSGSDVDPIMGILGGILGGGSQPQTQPSGAGGLGDILGDILGGGNQPQAQPAGAGGLADILGGILGGGSRASSNPIANILAEKLGLPPAVANMIVSFFMAKLLSNKVGHMVPNKHEGTSSRPIRHQQDSFDLDGLFDVMDDDDSLDNHIQGSGLDEELAEYAGIDKKSASFGLKELVKILGSKRQAPKPVNNRESDLKGLLDNW